MNGLDPLNRRTDRSRTKGAALSLSLFLLLACQPPDIGLRPGFVFAQRESDNRISIDGAALLFVEAKDLQKERVTRWKEVASLCVDARWYPRIPAGREPLVFEGNAPGMGPVLGEDPFGTKPVSERLQRWDGKTILTDANLPEPIASAQQCLSGAFYDGDLMLFQLRTEKAVERGPWVIALSFNPKNKAGQTVAGVKNLEARPLLLSP